MTAHSTLFLSAAAITLSVVTLSGAKADLCFRYGTGGGTLVAKGAKLPAQNTCDPLGLVEVGLGGRGGAATGSICRDQTDGRTIIFHYNYDACVGPGSYFESATCRLQLNNANDLPTASGGCRGTYGGGPFVDDTPVIDLCVGTDTTIPGGGGGQCVGGRSGFSRKRLDERGR
jgi:hypothetical protein